MGDCSSSLALDSDIASPPDDNDNEEGKEDVEDEGDEGGLFLKFNFGL